MRRLRPFILFGWLLGILCAGAVLARPSYAAPLPPEPLPIATPPGGPIIWWLPDLAPIQVTSCSGICGPYGAITNHGPAPAGASYATVTTTDSGITHIATFKVPALAVGATYLLVPLAPGGVSADCVTIRADSSALIAETNERNNIWQYNPFGLCP